ncbi:carbon-nitrogen hydrolase [Xylaria sp. FL0064]|nr:carbon-nitrogen hydrolase [Xylaria sp. FL0064]
MATHSTQIRLATASPATQSTRQETLVQLERLARSAGDRKADFLLLPEAYLGGYPRGSDFGCKIGGRTEEGRDEFRRYFREAIDLGDIVGPAGAGGLGKWVKRELGAGLGDEGEGESKDSGNEGSAKRRGDGTREELERIARETGVFIIVGLVERAGGSLYCAVVYVCPRRGMIGKRRKVMPTGTERLIWAQGSPATLQAVSTTIRGIRINLAAAICWENYMPLLRQSLYAQNINLYFAPTADGRDTWLPLVRTIGTEGRCFVVTSNMCVRKSAKHVPQERRNSCITKEGFEIALPSSPTSRKEGGSFSVSPLAGHGAGSASKARRRSVFDEDGNEIVLSSPIESPRSKLGLGFAAGASVSSSAVIEEDDAENTNLRPVETAKFVSRGGSSIVSPFGDVLAGPQWEDDEGIIYADVDMEDCVRGRLDLDAAGSYSRNDTFKLSVEGLNLNPLPYYI